MTNDHRPCRDRSKYHLRHATWSVGCTVSNSYSRCTSRTTHVPNAQERFSLDEHRHCLDRVQKGSKPSSNPENQQQQTLHGTQEKNDESCDQQDSDSVHVTLNTASCTTDDSSCFDAQESRSRDDGNNNCPIALTSVHNHNTNTECDNEHVDHDEEYEADPDEGYEADRDEGYEADHDDGYDTDQAVACDTTSLCSTQKNKNHGVVQNTQHRYKQSLDHEAQKNVHETVHRLLLEQTVAMDAWDEVATEYHRRIEPFTSLFIPHLLDQFQVSTWFNYADEYLSGKSVLDVAAGTGPGALYAASRGASFIMATDFSENMLHVLQKRIDAFHCNNLEARLANGMCLPIEWSNSYDVVFSNFGVIFFSKVEEGLSEMVRCTKPGGKVCISAWGSKEETHAFSVFPAAMKRCGGLERKWYSAQSASRKQLLGKVSPSSHRQHQRKGKRHGINLAPNYFCPSTRISSSACSLYSMMSNVGLKDVRITPVTKELVLDSAESYWNRFVLASPNLKRFIEHCLSHEEVMQLKEVVYDIVREESCSVGANNGVVLKASAYIAIGTKTSTR